MKNIKIVFLSLFIILGTNFIMADETANRMNSYENYLDPTTVNIMDPYDFKMINVKNTYSPEYVTINIVYEKSFRQARIFYYCPYELYSGENAYVAVRNCLQDFINEINFKHYQDIKKPVESYKKIDGKYTTIYMRYVKVCN